MSVLFDTGKVNADNILSAVSHFPRMEEFLHDDYVKIPIHCTSADCESLSFSYDIDGVVVQLKELCGVVGRVHYVFLPEFHAHMMNNHFEILRRHIKLSTLTQKHVRALHNCSGWTLGHVEGGYFLNISVVPNKNGTIEDMFMDKYTAKCKTAEILNAVVGQFKHCVQWHPETWIAHQG